ncbi:MAG: glycerophosphodiester phosphodiesterase [Chloroflexota bacterium]
MTRPLRLAHRGDWRRAPENTLPAFLAALRVPGCDGLEFDVRIAADGVPVVVHDETLDRVQRRPERVAELTAAALAELAVPDLAAVLAGVPRDVFLDIELKGNPGPAAVEVIAAARSSDRGLSRAVVSSYEPSTLEAVASSRPAWPRWLNVDDLEPATVALAVELACTGVSADWRAIDPGSAARVAAAGLDLAAWTVRRPSTYRRLTRLGVVAICAEATALDRGGAA